MASGNNVPLANLSGAKLIVENEVSGPEKVQDGADVT
jgi:hypothetical protein